MHSKSKLIVSVILFILLCMASSIAHADYICGDNNGDGAVNISDAIYMINYVFIAGSPPPDPNCCDDCPSTVTDYDGNVYQTVLIGDQCWMMENLKVTHYRNGEPIPNVTDNGAWEGLTTGAYCEYDNDPSNVATYGRLYNWYAVDDSRNIAPEGWHVPSDAEWKQLEMYLGMSQAAADGEGWRGTDEGGKLKEAGTTHWYSPNTGATNESGFSALPDGYRNTNGQFYAMGYSAAPWCSTEYEYGSGYAWVRNLGNDHSQVGRSSNYKRSGSSVRCVKN